jgi:hypothetical protein
MKAARSIPEIKARAVMQECFFIRCMHCLGAQAGSEESMT